ncbi:MAG: sulfatase family protein [Planctomycetota bacterium]
MNPRIARVMLALIGLMMVHAIAAGADRPNVLFILTDQQSATMMSCTGNPWLKTPAMDYMAANGVRFERAYATNPVCVPSRIGLMTGRFPGNFGARENGSGMRARDFSNEVLETSLGQVMARAGYEVAYGGKVHLPAPLRPEKNGFTMLTSNSREKLASVCADYIRQEHAKPFFLFASFINPHDICYYALHGRDAEDWRKELRKEEPARHQAIRVLLEEMRWPEGVSEEVFYADHCPPLPANFEPQEDEPEAMKQLLQQRDFRRNARETYSARDWRLHRWAYARLTERVDRQVQMLLDALRESGKLKNTVVIYSSDHGDMDAAHRMEHKSAMYEESARIPLLVMDPDAASKGRVDAEHLISNGLDLLPTLCDYAGLPAPKGLKGLSFRPLVQGETPANWRSSLGVESEIGRGVIAGNYKYLRYDFAGKKEERLHDLESDPGELTHFTNDPDYADVLSRLRRQYVSWFPPPKQPDDSQ